MGKHTARGVVVDGSLVALEAELVRVFSDMDGEIGRACRRECERVNREFAQDQQEGGRAWNALKAVASLGA